MKLLAVASLPGHGRQLGYPINRPVGQLRQHVSQIGPHIDLEPAAGFHDRNDRRHPRTGSLAADVQPVFAPERQRAKGPFAPVMSPPDLCRVAA